MGLPYFPLFPADFEAGTSHLTLLEDGVYNRLLRLCWMTPGCSLPADEAWIMRRVRARTDEEKEAVKTVLEEFFFVEKQRYSNARLKKEFEEANAAHEKRKKSGSLGGRAKSLKNKDPEPSNATPMPEQCSSNQNQNHNKKTIQKKDASGEACDADFEEFWKAYPSRPNNPKRPARQKFDAAVKRGADPKRIIAEARRYAGTRQGEDPKFTAQAQTWLGQERWEDAATQQPVVSQDQTKLLTINNNKVSESGIVERLLIHMRQGGRWPYLTYLGPAPGEPGCQIPQELTELAKKKFEREKDAA